MRASSSERTAFTWYAAAGCCAARTTGPGRCPAAHGRVPVPAATGACARCAGPPRRARQAAARFFWGSTGVAQERSTAGTALFVTRYDAAGRVIEPRAARGRTRWSPARISFSGRVPARSLSSTETLPGAGKDRATAVRRGRAGSSWRPSEGPRDASERTEYDPGRGGQADARRSGRARRGSRSGATATTPTGSCRREQLLPPRGPGEGHDVPGRQPPRRGAVRAGRGVPARDLGRRAPGAGGGPRGRAGRRGRDARSEDSPGAPRRRPLLPHPPQGQGIRLLAALRARHRRGSDDPHRRARRHERLPARLHREHRGDELLPPAGHRGGAGGAAGEAIAGRAARHAPASARWCRSSSGRRFWRHPTRGRAPAPSAPCPRSSSPSTRRRPRGWTCATAAFDLGSRDRS